MKDTLMKSLLKSKSDEALEIEELIDKHLAKVANLNKKESEQFISDLLVYIMQNAKDTDKELLLKVVEAKVETLGYTIESSSLDTLYTKSAQAVASSVGAIFVFDKTDVQVLESMHRALVWMKEDGATNTQNRLKDVITKAMEGEVNMADLGDTLREEFSGIVDESSRYFEGVSDHVIRQTQSLTRAYQFEKAGVKEVKVVAVVDNRTSTICMSLDGRIIETKHITKQADAISAAKDIEQKKEVARWQSKPIFGALPSNVGLPPYHFRCRTIVVAFFRQKATIDGKNVNGSVLPGEKYRGKEVLFSHIDRFGYERVVTVDSLDHDETDKHQLALKEIRAGLINIDRISAHARFKERSIAYSKQDEMLFVFKGGEVYTVFRPENRSGDYNKDRKISTEVQKGDTVLEKFNIRLGRSSHIKKEGLKPTRLGRLQEEEEYFVLPNEKKYENIAISAVNKDGDLDYIFIGQHYEAELVIEAIKDDPLFTREGHFTVEGRLEEKSWEFDGTLFDALLVIANEGAKYDI